jgi:hypothetical protein
MTTSQALTLSFPEKKKIYFSRPNTASQKNRKERQMFAALFCFDMLK